MFALPGRNFIRANQYCSPKATILRRGAGCIAICMTVWGSAFAQTYITIDLPGAVNVQASSINPAGVVTGHFVDANLVFHGFLRSPGGTITTFDAPGAGGRLNGTVPLSINPAGVITGYCSDSSNRNYCFIRYANGAFATFDPGGFAILSRATGITPAGVVTGITSIQIGRTTVSSVKLTGPLRPSTCLFPLTRFAIRS